MKCVLGFPLEAPNTPVFIRLTAAIDFREEKRLSLITTISNKVIGEWVMTFAHPYQPFEFEIPERFTDIIRKEGIRINLSQGEDNAWFYASDENIPEGFQPHLLVGNSPGSIEDFFNNLYSMNSFSPFGWMGGTVQDALFTLHKQGHAKASFTLRQHLEHYLDDEVGIRFESPNTIPLDGSFNSIEDFLPFAAIVTLYPTHPSIDKALAFMLEGRDENGVIGGNHITTEGCYTLAYPLMAIGLNRNMDSFIQIALDQLEVRKSLLTDEEAIYQRSSRGGQKSYRNWGRGVAWYLLGLVKTASLSKETPWWEEFERRNLKSSFVHLCGGNGRSSG
jgi:unsaturated rhamnogalacturonyl hydrolase